MYDLIIHHDWGTSTTHPKPHIHHGSHVNIHFESNVDWLATAAFLRGACERATQRILYLSPPTMLWPIVC